MRVGIYARVSTKDQDATVQTRELEEYAARRGWQIIGRYSDIGISGSKDLRPGLGRLMMAAKQRQIDAVLVWKLDRFARSLRHLVNALAEFEALGVAFVSLRDNLDLSTPAGRLMFQIVGAMAEFERTLTIERVMAGLRKAREDGRVLGRPRLVLDAAKVHELRRTGQSWSRIARATGQTASACRRALARYEAGLAA
jgi:DNA invertase Pin-like site-specific DNA recombinase